MKIVTTLYIAMSGLFLTGASMAPAGLFKTPGEVVIALKKDKLAGIWDYSVQDVPPEYRTGVLHILKEGREYQVTVELTNGKLQASGVTANRNTIKFYLVIDGQRVDVSLKVEGDTISGQSTSPDGVFPLQGTRRIV